MWHMTHGGGGEHSLKIVTPQLLRFGIDSVLKILNTNNDPIDEWMKDKGVSRTAPATPGLLIIYGEKVSSPKERQGNRIKHPMDCLV